MRGRIIAGSRINANRTAIPTKPPIWLIVSGEFNNSCTEESHQLKPFLNTSTQYKKSWVTERTRAIMGNVLFFFSAENCIKIPVKNISTAIAIVIPKNDNVLGSRKRAVKAEPLPKRPKNTPNRINTSPSIT